MLWVWSCAAPGYQVSEVGFDTIWAKRTVPFGPPGEINDVPICGCFLSFQQVELAMMMWISKAPNGFTSGLHVCLFVYWIVFLLFSNLGQYSKYAWDKSSNGQDPLEVHVHPSEWSIEETLSSSIPGQLEYLSELHIQGRDPKWKCCQIFSCDRFSKGLEKALKKWDQIIKSTSKMEWRTQEARNWGFGHVFLPQNIKTDGGVRNATEGGVILE